MPSDKNSTNRFSDRVDDYVKYRPGYPAGAVDSLRRECGLAAGITVADLGSGTGILTKALLDAGAVVYAIEPNDPMRAAAERELGRFAAFKSLRGTAESTGLPDRSIDLITAAQAFHWFDIPKARIEAKRILKSEKARVALLWNERITAGDPFHEQYEALIRRHSTDYNRVDHRNIGPVQFDAFFGTGNWEQTLVANEQVLDFEGLGGRLLSSSYVPSVGKPGNDKMMADLRALFDAHASDGHVTIRYEVKIVTGTV